MTDHKRYYYAVHKGYKTGVFNTWADCQKQIKGFKAAKYRKFPTKKEAELFVKTGTFNTTSTSATAAANTNGSKFKKNDEQQNNLKRQREDNLGDEQSNKLSQPIGDIIVYTDGASSKNGTEHAVAGFGVFWGDGDDRNVSEPLEGERQTNQRAELMAIIKALEQSQNMKESLEIRTDSQYSIKAVTIWYHSWVKNGWRTGNGQSVQNEDLIKRVLQLKKSRAGETYFSYVPGHKGVYGNEMADKLAVKGAMKNQLLG